MAADIIRTVVLEPTINNVLVLGLLVLIRTFLSWSLVLEIEERWPWQPRRVENEDAGTADQRIDETVRRHPSASEDNVKPIPY